MSKLLSICVPTYNRPRELEDLADRFLKPALARFQALIEVIVCDNSDATVALDNAKALGSSIQHYPNQRNLGFAGNLLQCVRKAKGRFIWIISDNDPILWPGFEHLMTELVAAESKYVQCLMLPFECRNLHGDLEVSNRAANWGPPTDAKLVELLQQKQQQLPFILFSSAVVRLDRNAADRVEEAFSRNDYLQIPLFLEMLEPDAVIRFLPEPVIDYQPEVRCRFTMSDLARSMQEVRVYVESRYGVKYDPKNDFAGWLLWLLHHRGGSYRIKNADVDRWSFVLQVPSYLSVRNVVLAVLLVVPGPVLRPLYLLYKTRKEQQTQGHSGIRAYWSRLKRNRQLFAITPSKSA